MASAALLRRCLAPSPPLLAFFVAFGVALLCAAEAGLAGTAFFFLSGLFLLFLGEAAAPRGDLLGTNSLVKGSRTLRPMAGEAGGGRSVIG